MQLPPSPAWSFCIKHYLFLKCRLARQLRLFSDGNTGMVFIIRGRLKIQKEGNGHIEVLAAAFIYGQLDRYQDVFSDDDTEMLIVVFKPYGFFGLSGIPAGELKAQIVDASLVFGCQISSLIDVLRSSGSYVQAISATEEYFANHVKTSQSNPDQLRFLVKSVMQAKGQLTVKALLGLSGYSERKLERVFDQAIGISPARYLQIVRLHHFLSLIRSAKQRESLMIAGLESGYYDQPHLIHNFKNITGLTPTQYMSTAAALAVNLVIVN